jgi:hypothetical protein
VRGARERPAFEKLTDEGEMEKTDEMRTVPERQQP